MSLERQTNALDELLTLESAAQRWPQLFTAIELRRAARAGHFQHIHKGRKRFVTERELMEWLHLKEVGASCLEKSYLKLADSGSRVSPVGHQSTGSGMTPDQERLVAEALKQRMSKRPKGF